MSDLIEHYKTYNKQGEGHYFLEWFKGSSRHLMIENWLKTYVKPGGKVLDIGCGDGSYSHWIPAYNWTGIDIGESKKPYNGTWVKGNLESVPYNLESGTFDAVICSEVLEHLFNPEKVHTEAYRLLKPKGTYIISTPNFLWIEHLIYNYSQVVYDPVKATHTKEHIRFYTTHTHFNLLNNAGFQPLDFQGADLQWGEFFQEARGELKKAMPDKEDGEIDLLLGKMFRDKCHTIGIVSEKK